MSDELYQLTAEWLVEKLLDRPLPAADLKREAAEWASPALLAKARKELNIVSVKKGRDAFWALQDTPPAQFEALGLQPRL